jgi:hypothetical protein
MSSLIIPFSTDPTDLRPRLPTIVGNVDYLTLCQRLEQIEGLLQPAAWNPTLWSKPCRTG